MLSLAVFLLGVGMRSLFSSTQAFCCQKLWLLEQGGAYLSLLGLEARSKLEEKLVVAEVSMLDCRSGKGASAQPLCCVAEGWQLWY